MELSETGRSSDLPLSREFAKRLHEGGCKLALDDFGAAFATLQFVKHIPFDFIKIDGEYIRELPSSPPDLMIVKAVAEIVHGFGAEVVAEFVGSQETVDLLKLRRCSTARPFPRPPRAVAAGWSRPPTLRQGHGTLFRPPRPQTPPAS